MAVFSYKSINNLEIEVWGDGEVIRDYIYIGDVVDVLIKSIKIDTPEIIYNLGSGEGRSLNEIIKLIKEKFNPQIKVKYVESRNFDVPTNILDIKLLKKRFEWKPLVDFELGIGLIYEYIKSINK